MWIKHGYRFCCVVYFDSRTGKPPRRRYYYADNMRQFFYDFVKCEVMWWKQAACTDKQCVLPVATAHVEDAAGSTYSTALNSVCQLCCLISDVIARCFNLAVVFKHKTRKNRRELTSGPYRTQDIAFYARLQTTLLRKIKNSSELSTK